MRDAFGGAFMIKLLIVFIVIYVTFIAIALNYAKAFKVKNKVISYIEENEIINMEQMSTKAQQEMDEYIAKEIVKKMGYDVSIKCPPVYDYCKNGILIVPSDSTGSNKIGTYYTVTTTFGWEIPFLNILLKLNDENGATTTGYWTISGETRTIVGES